MGLFSFFKKSPTPAMDDKIEQIVEKVVKLPFDFHRMNKSIYTLLEESGYFENYNQVDESNILIAIKKQPDLVNDWLQYSDDQRSSPCWYFKQSDDKKYFFVGHYTESKKFEGINFTNKLEACAAFVKRYIELVRKP